MSLEDFWISVRTGASLLAPLTVASDSPNVDMGNIRKRLANPDMWLNPSVVEGFDENDLSFLSENERVRLVSHVTKFLAVANTIPQRGPANQQQVRDALPEFQGILDVMRPDKYHDLEALILGKRIEHQLRGRLPSWVNELTFETGYDASGDPAIWIWVEVEDAAAESDVLTANFERVRALLERAVRTLGIERWPYVRLCTVSEQQNAVSARKK